jgi:hypothetical protein
MPEPFTMKAISLWQPWASFIAIGVKPYETRSWRPPSSLIGDRIAIHAAKRCPTDEDREWARRHGIDELPLGSIVCTALLVGAYQCGPIIGRHAQISDEVLGSAKLDGVALTRSGVAVDEFGDYAAGRWAWLMTDVLPYYPTVPARGAQGIWNWRV